VAEALRVDPEALADAVHRMAEFQRHAKSALSEIDSLVTDLHATWSGEGAAAHAEAHRHWAIGEANARRASKTVFPRPRFNWYLLLALGVLDAHFTTVRSAIKRPPTRTVKPRSGS